MKIGILCAGDEELAPFLLQMEECKVREKAMLKFYEGKLCGVNSRKWHRKLSRELNRKSRAVYLYCSGFLFCLFKLIYRRCLKVCAVRG